MIIDNFKELATTKQRRDALKIINAGIESVLVEKKMNKDIHVSKELIEIGERKWQIRKDSKIYVVGAGKAAGDMAKMIEKKFGAKIKEGLVIDTRGPQKFGLKRIKVVKGTHPLPSQKNIEAAKKIVEILEKAERDDIVINLISGGGSALLAYPRVSLKKLIRVNKLLLDSGATIQEINTIRKHISKIKGGQLSELAGKARVITLIVSDVITNNLDVIASGPSVKDLTTIKDARRIQKKYKLPNLYFVETPKKRPWNTTNILLITNKVAVKAMQEEAKKLNYKVEVLTTKLKGEASEVGKRFAKMAEAGKVVIAAGETTVTIHGKGKGGRNQELALSASKFIKEGVLVSSSTDGVDFITQAAGGIVDTSTKELAEKKGLDSEEYLENNDSYNFLKKVNGIIKTGKTGTNVCDLIVVLG